MAGALVFSKNYLEMVDAASMTSLQAGCSAVLALIGCVFIEGGMHLETTTGTAWVTIRPRTRKMKRIVRIESSQSGAERPLIRMRRRPRMTGLPISETTKAAMI